MAKAYVEVGYTRSDLTHYKRWNSPGVEGADVTCGDGMGNNVKVSVRAGLDGGFRVTVNGTEMTLPRMATRPLH